MNAKGPLCERAFQFAGLFYEHKLVSVPLRQDRIEQDRNDSRQANALDLEIVIAHFHAADTDNQNHRCDNQITRFCERITHTQQGRHTNHGNGTEENDQNTAHDRHRNGRQDRTERA